MDESTAGVPHVRGERSTRSGFTVLDGSASEPAARPRPRTAPQDRPQRPSPRNAGGGYNRIDLNSDPSLELARLAHEHNVVATITQLFGQGERGVDVSCRTAGIYA